MMFFSKYANQIVKTMLVGAKFSVFVSSVNFTSDLSFSMHDGQYTFSNTLVKFDEPFNKYDDEDIEFELRLNGEQGSDKNYVIYLNQGLVNNTTAVATSHLTRLAPSIMLMGILFLFTLTIGNN